MMPSHPDKAPLTASPDLPIQRHLLLAGTLLLASGILFLFMQEGARLALLLFLGALLGVSLYHAAFGFTHGYRRLLRHRDGTLVKAQLVSLALATLLFAPVLSQGAVFGHGVAGALAPVGWQVAIGAFLFGLGMQLAGGCGSGTLFTLGGGSIRMLVVLLAFCAGSFWASLHMGWWQQLPSLRPISLGETLGWPLGVGLQLLLLMLLWLGTRRWANKQDSQPLSTGASWWRLLATGPWPVLWGALALAVLNFATLLTAGHPWTITWAFSLWGAKTAMLLGWDPTGDAFWSGGFQQWALGRSIWQDTTSVMNMGIVIGAFCAAALAGRIRPEWRIPARALLTSIAGGLALGYGARIAFGCNIGAFFSGIASTSLHGWLWILAALPGNWLGTRLRPAFGLND